MRDTEASRQHILVSHLASGDDAPPCARELAPRARRAFTLVEMIVVLVLMAIIASMVVPRMSGNETREFKNTVDQVSDLLTMYAQRQNLGQKVVGIYHDRARNALELVVQDAGGDPSVHTATWQRDFYVQPVVFPRFMLDTDIIVRVDGDAIDAGEYPVTSDIGQERPWLEITMRGAGEQAIVSLPPYGVAPTLSASFAVTGVHRTKYDLDGAGRSREDW